MILTIGKMLEDYINFYNPSEIIFQTNGFELTKG